MRDRHWQEISRNLAIDLVPNETLTLQMIMEMNLGDHIEMIQKVAESAAKEYQIEQVCGVMS